MWPAAVWNAIARAISFRQEGSKSLDGAFYYESSARFTPFTGGSHEERTIVTARELMNRCAMSVGAVWLFLAVVLLKSIGSAAEFDYDRTNLSDEKPWTSEEFTHSPDEFQFAVIGDRTGGADPRGIFVRALDQLNLLRPEFVINVGDIIEGYTDDRDELTSEWDEVDGMLDKLAMPFFRTVGNHDISNPTMKTIWLERYGADYYHFVYRNVLFLVLSTEDPPRPVPEGIREDLARLKEAQLEDPARARALLKEFLSRDTVIAALGVPAEFSGKQVAYVKSVLAQNPEVRWTFLFLHEPAWKNPSQSFLEIERQLKDRDYTFFAGHLHYYDIDERDGREYITMGPAGASWHKDGDGNVDHILWVTMSKSGPVIAKITLDGIYDRRGRDLQLREMYER